MSLETTPLAPSRVLNSEWRPFSSSSSSSSPRVLWENLSRVWIFIFLIKKRINRKWFGLVGEYKLVLNDVVYYMHHTCNMDWGRLAQLSLNNFRNQSENHTVVNWNYQILCWPNLIFNRIECLFIRWEALNFVFDFYLFDYNLWKAPMQNVEYIGTTTINKLYAVNSSCHQLPFRTEVGRSGLQLVPAENQTGPFVSIFFYCSINVLLLSLTLCVLDPKSFRFFSDNVWNSLISNHLSTVVLNCCSYDSPSSIISNKLLFFFFEQRWNKLLCSLFSDSLMEDDKEKISSLQLRSPIGMNGQTHHPSV